VPNLKIARLKVCAKVQLPIGFVVYYKNGTIAVLVEYSLIKGIDIAITVLVAKRQHGYS
jgi:hypothetical protein